MLLDFDNADGGVDSSSEEDSDSDDDTPLGQVASRLKDAKHKYWLDRNKPMRGETADEYSKRLMEIVTRSIPEAGQRSRRTQGANQVKDVQLGAAARKYFAEKTGKTAVKPDSIVQHRNDGPVQGNSYQVKWNNVGYGGPILQWHGGDFVLQWPELLEDYKQVIIETDRAFKIP